jgi:hypothetical protein
VKEVRLSRVRVDVDVVAALFGLPGEELETLNFGRAARVSSKVVAGKDGLLSRKSVCQRENEGKTTRVKKRTSSGRTFATGASLIDLVLGS